MNYIIILLFEIIYCKFKCCYYRVPAVVRKWTYNPLQFAHTGSGSWSVKSGRGAGGASRRSVPNEYIAHTEPGLYTNTFFRGHSYIKYFFPFFYCGKSSSSSYLFFLLLLWPLPPLLPHRAIQNFSNLALKSVLSQVAAEPPNVHGKEGLTKATLYPDLTSSSKKLTKTHSRKSLTLCFAARDNVHLLHAAHDGDVCMADL